MRVPSRQAGEAESGASAVGTTGAGDTGRECGTTQRRSAAGSGGPRRCGVAGSGWARGQRRTCAEQRRTRGARAVWGWWAGYLLARRYGWAQAGRAGGRSAHVRWPAVSLPAALTSPGRRTYGGVKPPDRCGAHRTRALAALPSPSRSRPSPSRAARPPCRRLASPRLAKPSRAPRVLLPIAKPVERLQYDRTIAQPQPTHPCSVPSLPQRCALPPACPGRISPSRTR